MKFRARRLQESDREWIVALLADPRVTRYLPFDPMDSAAAHARVDAYLQPDSRRWTDLYENAETGEAMGYGICRPFTWEAGYEGLEIGYILHPAAWGKGLATFVAADQAAKARAASPEAIFALIHDENVGSRRAVEKAGFTRVAESKHQPGASIWRL